MTRAIHHLDIQPIRGASSRTLMRTFIAACFITALAGRLVWLKRSFDYDASMFIYLGKAVCDGLRFCHDITDNKFPSVGLMTSLCWRLFGNAWTGYVLFQTALSFAGAWLLSRCAARNIGEHARLPTALAALVYINFTPAVFGGFQLETLQITFEILAACSAIEAISSRSAGDAFIVGLAAGCAAMFKPTGLATFGAFAITLMWCRDRTRLLGAAFLGLLIPMAVVFQYLIGTHILGDMPQLYRQVADYATQTPLAADDLLRPLVVLILAGFGIVIRGWVFRRDPYREEIQPRAFIVIFACIWFAAELLGAVMQRRMYLYHFLPISAPAALLFGMLPRRCAVMPMLASLGPVMVLSLVSAYGVEPYPNPPTDILPISAYLREHAATSDSIWIDQAPRVLLETNLRSGSRYAAMFVFGNSDTAALEYTPVLLDDLQKSRPAFVILPTDLDARLLLETTESSHLSRSPIRAANYCFAWRALQSYVWQHYLPEAQVGSDTVYRRQD